MSIAMERFGSVEHASKSRVVAAFHGLVGPFRQQCRACGFEADDAIGPASRCPKCFGSAWERFAAPGSLLVSADQHTCSPPTSLTDSIRKKIEVSG
jgi:hypothetical protein